MHKKLIHHLQQLKEKLTTSCTICNGKSCGTCSAQFDHYEQIAFSGIPLVYWNLDLHELNPESPGVLEVTKYLEKLPLAYDEGRGLFIYGKNGNGKTLCACAIGKQALRQGYTVRYTFLGDVISAFVDAMYDSDAKKQLREDILGVDFLILDDVDKAYISEDSKYIHSILDGLFRARAQNCLPVIMTANKPLQDILQSDEEVFTRSLLSLFDESLLPVMFMGADKRAELKKDAIKRFLKE